MAKAFTSKQSKVIKNILGDGYGGKLYKYLYKHKAVKSTNVPSTIAYLYQIVNGQKTSKIIQKKILDMVETELLNQAEEKQRLKLLLG
ncbi:MAG: hypothetical protein COA88_15715 [Kordia sp.]|nr:MAG: hypothetical protein COA88_15715 [Kordia sp.]